MLAFPCRLPQPAAVAASPPRRALRFTPYPSCARPWTAGNEYSHFDHPYVQRIILGDIVTTTFSRTSAAPHQVGLARGPCGAEQQDHGARAEGAACPRPRRSVHVLRAQTRELSLCVNLPHNKNVRTRHVLYMYVSRVARLSKYMSISDGRNPCGSPLYSARSFRVKQT